MVPVWMTFNDLFKVTIIQSQITWEWYNIQLYLQWPSGRPIESRIWSIERRHFFNDLEPPLPPVSRLRRSLTLNISEVRHTVRHTFNGGTYRRSTQHCHFEWPWVILSDLAKYSAIQSARGFSPTAEFLVSQAVITKLYFRINFVNSSWTLSKLGDKACCDVNFLKFLPRPGTHCPHPHAPLCTLSTSSCSLARQLACRGVNRLSCKCQGRICVILISCHDSARHIAGLCGNNIQVCGDDTEKVGGKLCIDSVVTWRVMSL